MKLLTATTSRIAELLLENSHSVSVAESTTGGLIAASLLSYPGASGYFRGGSVVYTLPSRRAFLNLTRESTEGLSPLSEPMAAVFATSAREVLDADWGISELGAAGPSGSRYGHEAGTSVIGIDGPVCMTTKVETGTSDREANMWSFSEAALTLFETALASAYDKQ